MVQRTQTLIFDDLDDTEADETLVFAIDGVTYEIDLTAEHAAELRQGLDPWIKAGRRRRGARPPMKTARSSKGGADGETAKVRAWAREQGLEVSDRGRIPVEIREAYKAAR
jgi:hypothetical protein